jgi:hypothetical protein
LSVRVGGTVEASGLQELSGLVASSLDPNLLWATNDSGNESGLFALSLDGTDRGFFPLVDASGAAVATTDVEDLALVDGTIYVADIGDNNGVRDRISVLLVDEPPVGGEAAATVTQRLDFRYPGGARDAEALLVDPVSGSILVLDKDLGSSRTSVFVAEPPFGSEQVIELVEAASFDLADFPATLAHRPLPALLFPHAVTAADIDASGSTIAVRTYGTVWLFSRALGVDGESVWAALQSQPCEGASALEPQGEAVALLPDSGYVTVSEGTGQPVHIADR